MQVNIICDAHGYYVIDMIDSAEQGRRPSPDAVERTMTKFRARREVRKLAFSEEKLEYFHTEMDTWKELINQELGPILRDTFGMTARYFTYDEDPPIVRIDLDTA